MKQLDRRKIRTAVSRVGLAAVVLAVNAFIAGCGGSETGESEEVDLADQALAAAKASGICIPEGGIGGELHIYTWIDYFAPDVLDSFGRALGVKVVVDTFDSNEVMYAKLKAGGSGYDLMTPSNYLIDTMVREGIVDAIDASRIPNVLKNFDRSFASQVNDPKFRYSVPYTVTYAGIIYLKDKVPEGVDVNSWAILGNPALKGRVSLLDDIRQVVGAGLMYLGYSINSTDPQEIEAAVRQVIEWRANIRKFDGESYKNEVPSGSTWVGLGYSTDVTQVIVGNEREGAPARDDIGFALPKEGFAINFDELVIAKDSPRKDIAHAFINYIYDGAVAKVNMEYILGPNPVKPGIDALDENLRKRIILDPEVISSGQLMRGVEDIPGARDLYSKAWDKIRAVE